MSDNFTPGKTINKVVLIGRVGTDPEDSNQSPTSHANVSFRLATNDVWRDKDSGDLRSITDWHTIRVRGKKAETILQYLKKGDEIYIEGAVRNRPGRDRNDGAPPKFYNFIELEDFKFLGERRSSNAAATDDTQAPPANPVRPVLPPHDDFPPDDAPFGAA